MALFISNIKYQTIKTEDSHLLGKQSERKADTTPRMHGNKVTYLFVAM